ncbi:hypothetical protein [Salipiger abyssi]|uniref:hypothetical protein n=1 Tax=Salipiger abyssi TaxID=1250539 RepID=UPI004059AA9D
MIRALGLSLALSALAQPALALSCAPANVIQDFANAAASPNNWVVADGVLSFDPALLPPSGPDRAESPASFPARFAGMGLGHDGFTIPFDWTVTVQLTCAAHWCGSIAPGDYLAFLKQGAHGYEMIVGPCPAYVHRDPTEAQKAAVLRCFRQGGCD